MTNRYEIQRVVRGEHDRIKRVMRPVTLLAPVGPAVNMGGGTDTVCRHGHHVCKTCQAGDCAPSAASDDDVLKNLPPGWEIDRSYTHFIHVGYKPDEIRLGDRPIVQGHRNHRDRWHWFHAGLTQNNHQTTLLDAMRRARKLETIGELFSVTSPVVLPVPLVPPVSNLYSVLRAEAKGFEIVHWTHGRQGRNQYFYKRGGLSTYQLRGGPINNDSCWFATAELAAVDALEFDAQHPR